jgi:hypothetical protein
MNSSPSIAEVITRDCHDTRRRNVSTVKMPVTPIAAAAVVIVPVAVSAPVSALSRIV